MCARTGLWEPRVGNGLGPPGQPIADLAVLVISVPSKGRFFDLVVELGQTRIDELKLFSDSDGNSPNRFRYLDANLANSIAVGSRI